MVNKISKVFSQFPDSNEFICLVSASDFKDLSDFIVNTIFSTGIDRPDDTKMWANSGYGSMTIDGRVIHFCKWAGENSMMGPVVRL